MKTVSILFVLMLLTLCESKKNESIQNNKINELKTPSNKNLKEVEETQNIIEKNVVLGKYDYRKNMGFKKVSNTHSSKTIYLNEKVYSSFVKMFDYAEENNIDLKIVSGTRSFYEQKSIWERKWEGYKNLEPEPINRAKKF